MKYLFTLFAGLLNVSLFAQGKIEMADTMRSNGKIYVVVATMLLIMFAILLLLVAYERRIRRLEKQQKDRN